MPKRPKGREACIEFLKTHFRYNTMNSWNCATSYARNVKISHLDFPDRETRDTAFDMLDVEAAFFGVHELIREFAARHNHEWQIGFNGRSGGYMVLYQGGCKPSEYKTVCYNCGQQNFQADAKVCGVCHSDDMHPYKGVQVFTYPGKGLDGRSDWEEWDDDELKARVDIVWEFDEVCEQCVQSFIGFCQEHRAQEAVVMVPKKVKQAILR